MTMAEAENQTTGTNVNERNDRAFMTMSFEPCNDSRPITWFRQSREGLYVLLALSATTFSAIEQFGNAWWRTTMTRVDNRSKLLNKLGFSENWFAGAKRLTKPHH